MSTEENVVETDEWGNHTVSICNEVIDERAKQDAKWGEQTHGNQRNENTRAAAQKAADRYKRINDSRVAEDALTWDGVLLEEVYEAIAEADSVKLREELIQVAAVAVAWVQCIDRAAGVEPALL